MDRPKLTNGFTIVELLIVVVVIAILAAITIVSYTGIQNRSKQSAAQSAAATANKKVLTYAIENTDLYPANLATAGITNNSTTFQYTVNNTSSPRTYGITATNGTISYFTTNTIATPIAGAYDGHQNGGVATITNLILNPSFETNTTSWNNSGSGTTTYARNTAQFRSGVASLQVVADGTFVNQGVNTSGRSTAKPSTTYMSSIWFRGEAGKTVRIELGEWSAGSLVGRTNGTNTAATGSWQQLSVARTMTAAADSSDIVVRNVNAVTHTFYLDDAMITEGAPLYNYADGNSNQWAWQGTANNSISTGIPQ